MRRARIVPLVVAGLTVLAGCEYVVIPPEASGPATATGSGWTAVATSVAPGASGALEVALTIRNETGAWSAMQASDKPVVLKGGDGATTECTTVFVGTGGHRLGPGMQMRGYQAGAKQEPTTEPIRVECDGATATPGSTLALDYSYVTGEYNYYDPDATRTDATLTVELDQVATDLTYPIATPVEGLVVPPDTPMTGINDVVVTLTGVDRSGTALQSSWLATNPGEYPSYVHIGNPPVIGSDGVIYGWYESPDLESVPVTPAAGTAEWTTEVDVPAEVTDLIMLLSVESKKQRLFVNYALDLAEE